MNQPVAQAATPLTLLIRPRPLAGRRRRGAMLVLIVVLLFAFMLAVAFSVDIAQMHLSRTELRSATDAASKAAAVTLAETLSVSQAIARGQQIAAANTVNNEPLLLAPGDFSFGRSTEQANGKFAFTSGGRPQNSVVVNGRRTTDSRSGPVPLFFGNVYGLEFFEPAVTAAATYIERDIVLVVDRSGSMAGPKYADLTAAIDVFVATLNTTPVDESVGLASYSEFATEDVPLTENLIAISDGMRSLSIGGFTSISRGMEAGERLMNNSRDAGFVERTFIVMTDGLHNRGAEPRGVARRLAADNVTIHTITFGSDADQGRMREIARIGGGRHFQANDAAQLIQVYREIALTLNTLMTQ